jgi:hypothetical protein
MTVQQQIGKLQITMYNKVIMTVLDALQELIH